MRIRALAEVDRRRPRLHEHDIGHLVPAESRAGAANLVRQVVPIVLQDLADPTGFERAFRGQAGRELDAVADGRPAVVRIDQAFEVVEEDRVHLGVAAGDPALLHGHAARRLDHVPELEQALLVRLTHADRQLDLHLPERRVVGRSLQRDGVAPAAELLEVALQPDALVRGDAVRGDAATRRGATRSEGVGEAGLFKKQHAGRGRGRAVTGTHRTAKVQREGPPLGT